MVLGSIGTGATVAITIKAIDNFSNAFTKATSGMGRLSSVFKVGASAAAGVGTALTLIGKSAISSAVDFEETSSKFGVVFQDVSSQAEATAQNLRDNFGLSSVAAKQLLGDTGDLLTGFGFTGQAALDMSTQVQELAVDLASFTNIQGGAERASQALTKALLGERESVKELGIAILESDVQTRLAEKGLEDLTGTALKQAKAQVTLELAMEQSKNAIGDYERTSGSAANQMRLLQNRFEEIVVEIGQEALPVFVELLRTVADEVIPAIQPLIPLIGDALKKVLNFIIPILPDLVDHFVDIVEVAFELFDAVSPLIEPFHDLGFTLFPILLDIVKAIIPSINSMARALVPLLEILEPIVEFLEEFLIGMAEGFGFAGDLVFGGIADLFESDNDRNRRRVGDAILRPNGEIIETHPRDTIIATQNPGNLSQGGITIQIENINGLDANMVAEALSSELKTMIRL